MSAEYLPLFVEELPDLAEALDRLLRKEGRPDLAVTVPTLRLHAIQGDATLFFVPPESIERPPPNKHAAKDRSKWSLMYHPARKRHWLGRVPRRRWGLVVEEIDDRIAVLSLNDTAGALREQLASLRRKWPT